MPFSHHSHSGQFCPGHARNALEEMVQTAISKQMQVFALTEHMPRHDQDRYAEEIEAGVDLEWHLANETAYVAEARRLRQKYGSQIELPIGFESDWVRPESVDLIRQSIQTHEYDFFVGSVHHVHSVPIDYDHDLYQMARQKAGGSDERLFEDYFDAQLDMLQATKPPVVGHFDLIRLKSDHPNDSFQRMPGVWTRILRNLDFIVSYGGIIEINTASLRKGMEEPYPTGEICQAAVERNARFCLSDDSHGTDQVAFGYGTALHFLRAAGIQTLTYLKHEVVVPSSPNTSPPSSDPRFPHLRLCTVPANEFGDHAFWSKLDDAR